MKIIDVDKGAKSLDYVTDSPCIFQVILFSSLLHVEPWVTSESECPKILP